MKYPGKNEGDEHRSEMQKSKVEMVWPCEEEGGEQCWKKTVEHGTTWKERKGTPKAKMERHHQR